MHQFVLNGLDASARQQLRVLGVHRTLPQEKKAMRTSNSAQSAAQHCALSPVEHIQIDESKEQKTNQVHLLHGAFSLIRVLIS